MMQSEMVTDVCSTRPAVSGCGGVRVGQTGARVCPGTAAASCGCENPSPGPRESVSRAADDNPSLFQKQKNIAGALAFWMANASELLNFIKQDKDLSRVTLDAQDVLAHLVQMAFKWVSEENTLFIHPSICLCVCLSVSVFLTIYLSICQSVFLSLFGCLSTCLSICCCLSVCLSFCLSDWMSVSVCLCVSDSLYLCTQVVRVRLQYNPSVCKYVVHYVNNTDMLFQESNKWWRCVIKLLLPPQSPSVLPF